MKSYFLLVLFVALLGFSEAHKSQDLNEKDHTHKKEKDKKDYHRYEDWGIDNDWSDADMMQHLIDEAPRRENRPMGDVCSYSKDCASGCCLLDRDTRQRSCQPMARWGEKCSLGQVKGDLYVDACPCASGSDSCSFPAGVCSA